MELKPHKFRSVDGGFVNEDTGEFTPSETEQLALFEGHKIRIVEQKLKSCLLGKLYDPTKENVPKLYSKKYFVVEVKAIFAGHGDDKDMMLTKKINYELEAGVEIDEISAKRIIARM